MTYVDITVAMIVILSSALSGESGYALSKWCHGEHFAKWNLLDPLLHRFATKLNVEVMSGRKSRLASASEIGNSISRYALLPR
jgi:hypothetical protein